jgi:acetoin utilization deacetylase AcuC-like enzyme
VKLVYHPRYDLNLGAHVFPSQKYRLVRERLLAVGVASPDDFLAPEPVADEQVLLVHDPGWVQRLKTGKLGYAELVRLEIPWSPETIEAVWIATGGTLLAARRALHDRTGFNLGGGFHHAFPAHGEGFCAINDVAVAIRVLQQEGAIAKAMVIDCDVHHGNGTAAIFAADPSVFTLSIHQFDNYPSEKPPSTVDIHLPDGVGDDEYLARLAEAVAAALAFQPDLIFYLAGADPYRDDQLGGLALTIDGLRRRDRLILETALGHDVPVAVTLAGGYARSIEDTVTIHCNTVRATTEAYFESTPRPKVDP